ncbi:MAG: hypothetical protein ABJE66_29695 [Deltaproteobacteria bacterium]
MVRISVVLAVALAACGPSHVTKDGGSSGGDDADPFQDAASHPHTLVSLSVMPTDQLIEVDLNAPTSQAYTVTASYADFTTEDVTAQVTWNVMNPAVGSFTSATLGIPGFATASAVTSKLTASLNNVDGLAQITVVAHRPQDFFFILPYNDTTGPQNKPLNFATAIPALDVFFLMDVTGSMTGEIANLQNTLVGTVLPGIQTAVTNSQFGVGSMADFPYGTYGQSSCGTGRGDQPFVLRTQITATTSAVQSGVAALSVSAGGAPVGCGYDTPEAGLESIYQAATGEGLSAPAPTSVPANHVGLGGVGFRTGTMPVIVAITDALSHGVGETATCTTSGETTAYAAPVATYAHSRAQTKTALNNICARVVGIAPQPSGVDVSCTGLEYLQDLSTTTGARVPPGAWDVGTRPAGCAANQCCTGLNGVGRAPDGNGLCPVVFLASSTGTGVGASVVTGIQMLTRFATFDVTRVPMGVGTDINGNPLPAGHTTADFLKTIAPSSFVLPPPPPVLPNPTFDATTFHNVTPGTQVGFTVDAFNDFVPQTDQAQIFHATIQVLAGGCTPLDQRDVLILVPPNPVVIN